VQKIFRRHRYFDKAGIFMGDGSYIFVPDNENYEGSAKMLFDEHNHPVGKEQEKKMSAAQLKKCRWRRCYKMISLLHTNENGDFFLYAGTVATRALIRRGASFPPPGTSCRRSRPQSAITCAYTSRNAIVI
jgi:hypothetical protein